MWACIRRYEPAGRQLFCSFTSRLIWLASHSFERSCFLILLPPSNTVNFAPTHPFRGTLQPKFLPFSALLGSLGPDPNRTTICVALSWAAILSGPFPAGDPPPSRPLPRVRRDDGGRGYEGIGGFVGGVQTPPPPARLMPWAQV